jgi:UDP-N-acetylmuramyl pentapeptide phosphotransferase/UDP-N-acetylglucosamine-1-phosphate transferase
MSLLWTVGAAAVAAFLLTALLVEPARRLAWRYGLTDQPAGHKPHRRPTPYLGGVAILVGTLIPAGLGARGGGLGLWAVAGSAVVAAALGLADDLGGLSTRARLVVEVVLAAVLVAGGARLGVPGPGWLDAVVTAFGIVVVTNSFNLLDNADGALGTVGCASAVAIAALLFASGQPQVGLLMVCLAAACAGFLLHNAPPARIFMGDAGSLFIGLLLCAGATRLPVGHDRPAHLALLLLLVFPAAVDTGLVVLSRLAHGRSPLRGGTDHVAHRLRRLGLRGESVLVVLLIGGALAGLGAVLVSGGLLSGRISLAFAAGTGAVLIGLLMLADPGYPARVRPPVRRASASRHAAVTPRRPRVARTHSRG